jgi:two-component system OmpR family response regulator
MRFLIVEDDPALARWLRQVFAGADSVVDEASTAHAALTLGDANEYDLAVVDLELPDGNGTHIVETWRRNGRNWPVVILTVRDDDADVAAGLDAGADDYLVKPISAEVLRAHVRAILRRTHTAADASTQLNYGDLTLSAITRRVRGPLGEVPLTAKEYALLLRFLANPERVISRMDLLTKIWGFDFDPHTSVLEVAVSRLRRKLKAVSADVTVRAMRGMGFSLSREREAEHASDPV